MGSAQVPREGAQVWPQTGDFSFFPSGAVMPTSVFYQWVKVDRWNAGLGTHIQAT